MRVSRLCMSNLAAVLSDKDILAHFLSCLLQVNISPNTLKIDVAPGHDTIQEHPDIIATTMTRTFAISVGTWHSSQHITTEAAELASYLSTNYRIARNYVIIVAPEIPAAWPQDKAVHYIPPYPAGATCTAECPGNHTYIVRPGAACNPDTADNIEQLSMAIAGYAPASPGPLLRHIWTSDIVVPWDTGLRLLAKNTYRDAAYSGNDAFAASRTAIATEAHRRADAILTYAATYGVGLSEYELARALGLSLDDARAALDGDGIDISGYIKEDDQCQ